MAPFRTLAGLLGRIGLDAGPASVRDAARIALQSAAGAVLTYGALSAIGSEELFVGILSAVMIPQPSVGGTMKAARTRLLASVVGSVVGVACLIALPAGVGTAVGLVLAMLILNGLATLRPAWSYGVVAAVGLSIATGSVLEATMARLAAIAIGAGIGLAVAALLWPDTAGARLDRHLAVAMRRLRTALDDVLAKAGEDRPGDDIEGRREVETSLADAREACDAVHLADTGPRRGRIRHVSSLLDSVWLLDAVMERTGDLRAAGLARPIEDFRQAADRVLEGFTEDGPEAGALAALDGAFERLREALDDRPLPDPRGCDQAQVIAFAAGSIRDRLGDLARSMRHPSPAAPGWAARVSLGRAGP